MLTLLFTFLGCSAIYAFDLFLTWDASFQIYEAIHEQVYSVMPLRWIMYLLKAPFNLYILGNDSLNIAYAIKLFGITYSYIPFIIIFLLTIITKKNTQVFRLASFSILLPTVLYQYHPLSEHLVAIQIFWLFVSINATFDSRTELKKKRLINSVFVIILFFTHPVSSFLFIFWAIFHMYSYFKSKNKEALNVFILYGVIGLIRLATIYVTSSDQDTASVDRLTLVFLDIQGHSKAVLTAFFLIPVLLFASIYMDLKKDVIATYLAFTIVLLLFLYIFFNIQEQIISVLTLRYFQFIIHLPFLAYFYKRFFVDEKSKETTTGCFTILSSVLFMSIVSTMAIGRHQSIEKVINYYQSRNINCVTSSQVKLQFNTLPFGHFASPFEIVLHQKSLSPSFIILTQGECEELKSREEAWINLYLTRKINIYPTIDLKNIIKASHE